MLSAQVWEEEGEKRIYFSPSKVSHMGTRERLREEKEQRQGGGREGVGGKEWEVREITTLLNA